MKNSNSFLRVAIIGSLPMLVLSVRLYVSKTLRSDALSSEMTHEFHAAFVPNARRIRSEQSLAKQVDSSSPDQQSTNSAIGVSSNRTSLKKIYTIDEPYRFPITPGMKEWANLTDYSKMLAACDIPEKTVAQMSTSALVKTCLDYPLKGDIYYSSDSMMAGLETVMSHFSGLRELLKREDAGPLLLQDYRKLDIDKVEESDGMDYIDYSFLNMLFLRDEMLDTLSNAEKEELAKLSLTNTRNVRQRSGKPTFSEYYSAWIAVKLIAKKGVKITNSGTVIDDSAFDPFQVDLFLKAYPASEELMKTIHMFAQQISTM